MNKSTKEIMLETIALAYEIEERLHVLKEHRDKKNQMGKQILKHYQEELLELGDYFLKFLKVGGLKYDLNLKINGTLLKGKELE